MCTGPRMYTEFSTIRDLDFTNDLMRSPQCTYNGTIYGPHLITQSPLFSAFPQCNALCLERTLSCPCHTESRTTPHSSKSSVLCVAITTVQWANCTTASPNLICWHGPPMSKGGTVIGATHVQKVLSVKSSREDYIKITGVCTTRTSIILR